MLRRTQIKPKKRKGQSTVEYIILVAGVLALLLVFLGPGGVFQKSYNKTLKFGTDSMELLANRLHNSYAP